MPDWLLIAGGVAAISGVVFERYFSDDTDEWSADAARQAYVDGEIGIAELECRLDLALDDRAARVRETVEQVNGIGPETSAAIAMQFDSVAEVKAADSDELTAVSGVGEQRAEAIQDRL